MTVLYWLAQGYAALGAAVAVGFLLRGIDRVVPDARGAYAFRPLLAPGIVLLWPLVLYRWWRLTQPAPPAAPVGRDYRDMHRAVWLALAILLPLLLTLAIALRQEGPTERPPLRLSPPPSQPAAAP